MHYFLIQFVLSIIILFSVGCSQGLEPNFTHNPDNKTYLTGTIYYKNGKENWKFAQDSLAYIRVVGFKTYPDSAGIIKDILAGNVFITPKNIAESLPMHVDSSLYSMEFTEVPINVVYLAVVQQYGLDLTKQQRVIGVFSLTLDNSNPSAILIEKGKQNRANIFVDFENLPPQPF
ncbi:MAG: hypothetical protein IPM69_01865 [Ignavibacteria bacterium]|nr:hypothetical protein [Ignavibacteria bacterium]